MVHKVMFFFCFFLFYFIFLGGGYFPPNVNINPQHGFTPLPVIFVLHGVILCDTLAQNERIKNLACTWSASDGGDDIRYLKQ